MNKVPAKSDRGVAGSLDVVALQPHDGRMAPGRTFSEHLTNLADVSKLKPGARVRITISGRTGVLVDKGNPREPNKPRRHVGWLVRWDEPVFGVTEGRVNPSSLERT